MSAPVAPAPAKPSRFLRWHRRVLGVCLVIFAFELGIVLVILPWYGDYWELSWIPVHSPKLAVLWMSPYLRGALSGLGLLNIYVAIAEAVKQIKSLVPHPTS